MDVEKKESWCDRKRSQREIGGYQSLPESHAGRSGDVAIR